MMNCMNDIWSVFGVNQGQAVEIAYRYDADEDRIIRRISDGSDLSVEYSWATCPDDAEWNGSESYAPFDENCEWTPLKSNPFSD